MVGLMMAIFADPTHSIGMISHEMVKTGLGGLHGNKGAIVTRLIIDDTSLCFVNCHLAAGHSQVAARNTDLSTIMKNAHLPRVTQSECVFMGGEGDLIFDHEHVVLFGDLNYRLNTTREAAELAIHAKTFAELYLNDQLHSQLTKVSNHPLSTFTELPLNFPPTYKYDRGTDVLDTSEKQRIPAYCDRILLRTSSPDARLQNYSSHPLMRISDHRPISVTLTLPTKKIDYLKRETLRFAIQQDWLLKL
jgi:endonuclease/exonuclease/phosphatase family metal-dependent hydrolase